MKTVLGMPGSFTAALSGLLLSFTALTGCQAASETGAAQTAAPAAEVGKPAPQFTLSDIDGKDRSLSDYNGKIVVLEWFNHGCPFVKKHYESGNMQKLQRSLTGKGIIWLSINSSAEGKQGYASAEEHKKAFEGKGAAPTAVLLDSDGKVGRLYGAKTTPHMFVIDKKGTLAYAGAIDDKNGYDQAEIAQAKNYVQQAVDDLLGGKPVAVSSTKSYGCSVKYR